MGGGVPVNNVLYPLLYCVMGLVADIHTAGEGDTRYSHCRGGGGG